MVTSERWVFDGYEWIVSREKARCERRDKDLYRAKRESEARHRMVEAILRSDRDEPGRDYPANGYSEAQ